MCGLMHCFIGIICGSNRRRRVLLVFLWRLRGGVQHGDRRRQTNSTTEDTEKGGGYGDAADGRKSFPVIRDCERVEIFYSERSTVPLVARAVP
jgi:hypothetical protein